MPQNHVNSRSVVDVREALVLPLFPLIAYMQSMGWSIHLKYPCGRHEGFVGFEKKGDWHGLALLTGNYKFGYHLNTSDTSVVTEVARRSAELCLTVYETFTALRPGNPNVHGDITPDRILQGSPYAAVTQVELDQRHAHFAFTQRPPWNDDTLTFKLHARFVHIRTAEIPVYLEAIRCVEDALDGKCAITV